MLDIETLRKRSADGECFEYLYFWGHRPSRSGKIIKTCLSQWYQSAFTVDGVLYPTAEHWMMAGKARLFQDEESLAQILDCLHPYDVKALGRQVKNFNDAVWKQNARRLVTEGNLAKFSQNEQLKEFLLETENAVLVEASPHDRLWGIGLRANDERVQDPAAWQGQNLLGFALMDVREQLRAG
ncbi:DUF1768 domain-containing protein [bacterium]|nr:DUF1768 domain-containing protein [bacterium]